MGGMRILLVSDVTLFEYNVSTILLPIVNTACDSNSNCTFCTFKLRTVTPRTVLYHNVFTLLVLPS